MERTGKWEKVGDVVSPRLSAMLVVCVCVRNNVGQFLSHVCVRSLLEHEEHAGVGQLPSERAVSSSIMALRTGSVGVSVENS